MRISFDPKSPSGPPVCSLVILSCAMPKGIQRHGTMDCENSIPIRHAPRGKIPPTIWVQAEKLDDSCQAKRIEIAAACGLTARHHTNTEAVILQGEVVGIRFASMPHWWQIFQDQPLNFDRLITPIDNIERKKKLTKRANLGERPLPISIPTSARTHLPWRGRLRQTCARCGWSCRARRAARPPCWAACPW